MKIARHEQISTDAPKVLQDLVLNCELCLRTKNSQYRYIASKVTEDVRFIQRIYMEIMYLDGNLVLHLVYETKHF